MIDPLRSAELRKLVGVASEIAASVVAANAEREDREAAWPEPAIRALGEAGLMGLVVPRSAGGHGQGLTGLAAVTDTIAAESPSTALCFAMHCVGAAVIAAKATPHQEKEFLEPIAAGEHMTTLALSEPGTGAEFWIPESRLVREADGYVVTGTKSFVTNGGHADSYVVSTVSPDQPPEAGSFSCVLIEADASNLRWDAPWQGLGMRSNSSRSVRLDGVPVPGANLLGREGDQLWYVFEIIAPYFLTAMAATYMGLARACVDLARDDVGTRRHTHSGELLAASPLVSSRLGRIWTGAEQARQLVFSAAARGDAGEPDALTVIFASKAVASDAAVWIANEAMTLAGGRAYAQNAKLARMLRDARASHVMAPTTDALHVWVGRSLLNLPLL